VIEKIEFGLVKAESIIAAFSLLLLLVLSLVQILARNFFDYGFMEIEIINRNLLVICGTMGAIIATSKLRHIKIDALAPLLSKRMLSLLRCPLSLFSALVCAVMCYHAVMFVVDEWHYIPVNQRWALPFTLIYPLGFGLLGVHFLLNCLTRRADA
jgi:TRAP-type transport system small permease protein